MQNSEDFIHFQGDACFVRRVGVSGNDLQELRKLDACDNYQRIIKFDVLSDKIQIQKYQEQYTAFQQNRLPDEKLASACRNLLTVYHQSIAKPNPTIEKNLMVSVLFWYDLYLSGKKGKFVCSGKIGYKEYLFCYLAYLLKFHVMLLLPEGDLPIADILLKQSEKITAGAPGQMQIPAYQKPKPEVKISFVHPNRQKQRNELNYEEIARLARSVVMIGVFDKNGGFVGSGSGIAFSRKGYILTNLHVLNDGNLYAVRLENDEDVYPVMRVVKYHTVLDLAVIQIQKELAPLRIYDGRKELVRGQKVVAIGSPMGFMNSVSDGIISGFRKVDNQDFIQHTAAVSDGSCGGALLNTYGEIIGINTAHVRMGENMNLAVSYKQILPFILGFMS